MIYKSLQNWVIENDGYGFIPMLEIRHEELEFHRRYRDAWLAIFFEHYSKP